MNAGEHNASTPLARVFDHAHDLLLESLGVEASTELELTARFFVHKTKTHPYKDSSIEVAIAGVEKLALSRPNLRVLKVAMNRDYLSLRPVLGFSNLKVLHVEDMQLSAQNFEVLLDMPHLKMLNISGSEIADMTAKEFDYFVNIKELYMKYVYFPRLEGTAFRKLPSLRVLDMEGARIASLGDGDFDELTKLQVLNIGGINRKDIFEEPAVQTRKLSPRVFKNLYDLQDLSGCYFAGLSGGDREKAIEYPPLPSLQFLETMDKIKNFNFFGLNELKLHSAFILRESFETMGSITKLDISYSSGEWGQEIFGHSAKINFANVEDLDFGWTHKNFSLDILKLLPSIKVLTCSSWIPKELEDFWCEYPPRPIFPHYPHTHYDYESRRKSEEDDKKWEQDCEAVKIKWRAEHSQQFEELVQTVVDAFMPLRSQLEYLEYEMWPHSTKNSEEIARVLDTALCYVFAKLRSEDKTRFQCDYKRSGSGHFGGRYRPSWTQPESRFV
jgi:Leucine-rich repeat (LRR) protein